MKITMNQLDELVKTLPEGERFDRLYNAIEGDLRIISKDARGYEYRYSVREQPDGTLKLVAF